MKNRSVQIVILLVLFLGVAWVLWQNLSSTQTTVKEGRPVPDFTLVNLEGEGVTLSSLRGKGVLINFWATTCTYCLREMPAIERQYQKYKDKGLEVLGINTGENKVSITGYVNRLGVTFPILMDRDFQVTDLYQTGPLPRTIFVDPEGIVTRVILGEMNEGMIEANILAVLP